MKTIKQFLILVSVTLLITSCGDPVQERIEQMQPVIERQIDTLNKKLDKRELRNAIILDTYIKKMYDIKPELKELLDNLKTEIEPNNSRIKDYKDRLSVVKNNPKSLGRKEDVLSELTSLSSATNHEIYNDSLIDLINTTADLSDGKLQRLNVKRKKTDNANGPGSHLVGNSRYGRWQNRNGQSFWVWYGQYRLFSDLLWPRPYYYHSWYYDRPWSYHNDYGRNIYGSRSERQSHSKVASTNDRKVKEYGKKTGRSHSSYAKKSNSNFKPSSATKSATSSRTKSKYGSSHRSSSRSRSRFGGK